MSWEHVARMRAKWQPWREPHLVIDTMQPIETCVETVIGAGPLRTWRPLPAP
ncbi:hypothetical protein [Nonomuraea diastatica]|uniref:hypothetical protein n=1 Tax=Nonomuraea diastatica TaxID=1848329 RepID=UPI00140A3876|nr:hypothetical protein [Nonomuraea diastatica]